jgi:DNA polymerase-3 subunit gamma/tau
MLAPSLRSGAADTAEGEHGEPAAASTAAAPDISPRSVSSLADIERIWPDYLTRIETVVPKFLVLQMQRVSLLEFDSDGLHMAVDQEFGARMVEEHLPTLMDHMKDLTGQRIRFRPRVERSNRKESVAQDPFEQFKKVQQNDPIVKEIVELFGAELRYE